MNTQGLDQVKYVVDVLTNWQGDDDPKEWFRKWFEINVTDPIFQAKQEGREEMLIAIPNKKYISTDYRDNNAFNAGYNKCREDILSQLK